MAKLFQNTGNINPGRSTFNLNYTKKFNCDMGQLIPIMCDEVVPGDKFVIGNEVVIRTQPLVAPILHEINVYTHYFFVPYRLLWPKDKEVDPTDGWEVFITGGVEGDLEPSLPVYRPGGSWGYQKGTLYDYFGFPTGHMIPPSSSPLEFPWRAYSFVWNEFYRDENLQEPYDFVHGFNATNPRHRSWSKDYFTSSLPFQQRGIGPALPVTLSGGDLFKNGGWTTDTGSGVVLNASTVPGGTYAFQGPDSADPFSDNLTRALNRNLDWTGVSGHSVDIADLRLAVQVQKWLERNARSGVRYIEFIRAHFGVSPYDNRLQRPEYIGGTRKPVIISEVLQTSETADSPQGNLAGHGLSADGDYVGSYFAQEYGLILGLMSIMPTPAYHQGINRQWLRRTKYDFYFREFANLSEQAILREELYCTEDEASNKTVFGFQGRYDEMRIKHDMVCNDLRDTLDYWHLGRRFSAPPNLNQNFISTADIRKDIFAVQNEPGFIVNFANLIRASRPLPYIAEPGLVDHF